MSEDDAQVKLGEEKHTIKCPISDCGKEFTGYSGQPEHNLEVHLEWHKRQPEKEASVKPSGHLPRISETPRAGYKKFWASMSFLEVQFMVGVILGSRFLTELTYERLDGSVRKLKRACLNGILSSRMHNFKSEILTESEIVVKSENCARVEDVTFAGAVGSVDADTKTSTSPFFWDANRKVALIDEWQPDPHGILMQAFLKVMEWEPFTRNIAREVSMENAKDLHGELDTYFFVKKGKISVLTKSVFLIATMDSPQFISRSKRGEALVDRSLVLRYEVSNEESDIELFGVENEQRAEQSVPTFVPASSVVHLTKEDTRYLQQYYLTLFGTQRNPRAWEDMVRVYAVLGKDNPQLDLALRLVERAKKPLWRRPLEDESPEERKISEEEAFRQRGKPDIESSTADFDLGDDTRVES